VIKRLLSKLITSRLESFPAVAIFGPRQVGKTTLAKGFSHTYYDLELDQEKLRLDIQWNDLLESKELIILDEAQNTLRSFQEFEMPLTLNERGTAGS